MSDQATYAKDLEQSLPPVKSEYWRYTNLNALRSSGLGPVANDVSVTPDLADYALPNVGAAKLVLVNGQYRADLSDDMPEGVSISDAPLSVSEGSDLESLNARWAGSQLSISITGTVETPVHILSIAPEEAGEVAFHSNIKVDLAVGADATILETHIGGKSAYFSNNVMTVTLGTGAKLAHGKFQKEGGAAFHLADTGVQVEEEAQYQSFILQVGGKLARNEVRVTLNGKSADTLICGAYLAGDGQLVDNTTFVDHAVADATSSQIFKGVLDGKSRGVFQGKTLVRRDAQRTDGHQLNRTLLLSRDAEIDTRPELEIYADDVKCSHGATAGELDEDQLFYLQARGIDRDTARRILVEAYVAETMDVIENEEIRSAFQSELSAWLSGHAGA